MKCPKCNKDMKRTGTADLRMLIGRYDSYYTCFNGCKHKDGVKLCVIKSIDLN